METKAEPRPRQIEFARLNMTYTILSKRRLIELVTRGLVKGWDDPRMPTIAGMRRRGYPPEAIRNFCERIGVAKNDSIVDIALLEHCVRETLNDTAPRVMGVLRPLRLVIDNYAEGKTEEVEAPRHPREAGDGFPKSSFLPRAVHRAGRLASRIRPKNTTAWRRGGKCVCVTPT